MKTTFGLRIFAVTEQDDGRIVVDVYGGPTNAFGSAALTFPDDAARERKVIALKLWEAQSTVVDLVSFLGMVSIKPAESQETAP